MKKRATHFFFLFITTLFLSQVNAQFPTIYATVNSGTWNTAGTSPQTTIWESFTGNATNTPGAQGTGTAYTGPSTPGTINGPSGTHFVYIRANHTVIMNGANRSCHGMLIEAGGKLWANEATARRLQLVNGGTGFTYPQTDAITNNGTLGGMGDGIYFEVGTNCQNVTINGSGSTIIQRLRVPGGLGSTGGGIINITIGTNITFTQANNYAVSLIYNPQPTDNYSLTLSAGKTLTVSDPGGSFNNNSLNSGSGFGTYVYNMNGTLDLSAYTATANVTAISPIGGSMTLNINGGLKTGTIFNSSPVAPGVGKLNVASGVVVDATLATTMNFNENSYTLNSGTAGLKRTVLADGSKVRFPVGTANGSNTHVSISNTTGAADVVTVFLKNTFTNPAPANTLPREWNLVETTVGGNSDTLRFEWTTADESNGFSGASPNTVFIHRWNGTAWTPTPASVSGTGTTADPYVAKGSTAFSQLGLFILSNNGVAPVSFVNVKAYQKLSGAQIEFGNATELDIAKYEIEKSANGRVFTSIALLLPKTNNAALNNYTYFDASISNGNNFYRIKVTEKDGTIKYSSVLNIKLSQSSGIVVYPNPIKGKILHVQFQNTNEAMYQINIFNQIGQTIYTQQLQHTGRTATYVVTLPENIAKGIYSVQISNNSVKTTQKIIVE